MRKTGVFIFYVVFFAGFFLLSCSKDEVAELTTYNVPKATIKGKIFAQLDLVSPGYEFAPNGTKINIRIPVEDYGIDLGDITRNNYKIFQTTVNATGDYSFTIDATTSGVRVYVDIVQFEYLQYQGKDANNQNINVRRIYYINTQNISAIAGQTHYLDLYINDRN